MSQNEDIKPEFKTIRIPAYIYYKLAELTGLVGIIKGESASISDTTTNLVEALYPFLYPYFLNIINNPKELQKFRNELSNNKELFELVKGIKIKE